MTFILMAGQETRDGGLIIDPVNNQRRGRTVIDACLKMKEQKLLIP